MTLAALTLALSVLCPQPRQAELAPVTVLHLPVQVQAPAELAAPADLLRRELAALFGAASTGAAGGTVVRLELSPSVLLRAEEYALEPTDSSVLLRAHDEQGMFWAVHTLAALLGRARRTPDGYEADVPKIRDWPDTTFRAFMIQGAWTPCAEEFKRNLELLARQHVTYVALEFGPQVVLDFDPTIAKGGRFSKAQAREIIEYGRSLGLKPIAYLNVLGHLERAYQKPPYTQHGGIDLRSDEAYERFVYPILSETLEVYGPVEYFHCGMDEAWELFKWLSGEGADVTGLLTRHIQRVNDFLKARGVKTVIWHDMLIAPNLREKLGAPVGPANGGPPQNTAGALASIPRDVVLDYWFYNPLDSYPALDYLRDQGFAVWASPWQSPFSLTRYAHARQVPVMGTLWSGPPGCFASARYSPVTGLYAQAVWNASAATETVAPEPTLSAAVQRATSAVLWRRHSLDFPGKEALLLSPTGPKQISWPQKDLEQHYGVPLPTGNPVRLDPLPEVSKALRDVPKAASVRLPGGATIALDGVNTARGEDQLILYAAPRDHTGTNIYGVEVSVSATGKVLSVAGYGSPDNAIPAGGFVLSAHSGPSSAKSRRVQNLRVGDAVAVFDAEGNWLGGSAPTRLMVGLPDGQALYLDGQDIARNADQLVLYHSGYGDGTTGTNAFGVEVIVRDGKVTAVRVGVGNSAIPTDGYVLSAHQGETGTKATALRAFKVGDTVRLLVDRGGDRTDLSVVMDGRRQVYPVGARCSTLFLAMATQATSSNGTPVGEWIVRYATGAPERIPVRYGREVLAPTVDSLPQYTEGPVWLVDQPPLRCLVREWQNPRPEEEIREISFEPAPALLEVGAQILSVTAATPR
jgi:hypothetical protein